MLRFEQDADRQVVRLHRGLTSECYRPGDYRLFPIWEPKRRLIAAAAVRDRVVHHALHRVLAPLLDPNLIHTTYACLPNRGSHRALLAYLAALRRYRCVLMLDIRHY
ncbi:MAG: RNA-dependent DNA polymerase, partial [bacterium]|nr:RNA-dependent DNA polymerase [bacterium]